MSDSARAFVLSAPLETVNGVVCRVSGDQTGDAYTVLELSLPPGGGAPPHVHHREDEVFYVAVGTCEITVGGQTHVAETGAVVVLPKGQQHAFRNPGTAPNRIIITAIPGGLDRYFDEINALVASGNATQDDLNAINRKYEIDFSG